MGDRKDEKYKKRPSLLNWGIRILLVLAALFVILLGLGYLYQQNTTAKDMSQFPAPGQLVDAGGTRLHLYCTGEGSPTVVVDAGNGDFSLGWSLVQPGVSEFTRICTYDRAGYGWSESSPLPRTAGNIAVELHTLLTNAGETGPYILVGHSMGGHDVRMYASLYPDEVAGMVLVDAAHEEQFERLPPEYALIDRQQTSYLGMMRFLARFGVLRVIGNSSGGQNMAPAFVQQLPVDVQPVYLSMMSHPLYFETSLAELESLPVSMEEVAMSKDLGDMPLYVLTAGSTLTPESLQSIGLPPDFQVDTIQETWFELQNELATLSTQSEHIIVEGSGHAIHLDQPEAIIDAIRWIMQAID